MSKVEKTVEQIADEAALGSLVDQLEPDLQQPGAGGQDETAGAAEEPTAEIGLAAALVAIASSTAVMAYPCLSFDDATKGQAVGVLVPVLVKYDLNSVFLEHWKEEFAAGMFFAGVIFKSYQTIQADKEAKAAAKATEVTADDAKNG